MSIPKPLKKNFYTGGNSDIEMPPLDQVPPVLQDESHVAPAQPQQQSAFSVPDHLPKEVEDELDQEAQIQAQDQSESENVVDDESDDQQLPQKSSSKENNWKRLREEAQKAKLERDFLMAQLERMQQQQAAPQKQQQVVEEEPNIDFDVDDDALLEGKHAKMLAKKMKMMEKQMQQYQSTSYMQSAEARIKLDFPDFEQVVSMENVERLNEDFPELAETLRDTKDLYKKAASAYKVIKRTGIYQDQGAYMAQKQKAVENLKKPRPTAAVTPQQGDSPLAKANAFANGLTPELQKKLREEMYAARRGY